jgi:hypothetical protein
LLEGYVVFGGSHKAFTAPHLRSLAFCWEVVAHWRDPFPFSSFPALETLVINNVQLPWHDYQPHMEPRQLSEIPKLRRTLKELTIVGCVLPSERAFMSLFDGLGGGTCTLEVLRMPECPWFRDDVSALFCVQDCFLSSVLLILDQE